MKNNALGHLLLNLGFDPRRLKHIPGYIRYSKDKRTFLAAGGKIDVNMPVIADYYDKAGTAKGHYFHQDLLVASFVSSANPVRHVDIGSRVDGFVAHVAASRAIDIVDIRPLDLDSHPQIKFVQCDLMNLPEDFVESTDSLSCLHALEHFGLGRYGDPINPQGHLQAFENMVRMVQPGGAFYLSSPVGKAKVMFNAHRVFDPSDPVKWAGDELELLRFDYVDDEGALHRLADVEDAANEEYGCGIYTFRRRAS